MGSAINGVKDSARALTFKTRQAVILKDEATEFVHRVSDVYVSLQQVARTTTVCLETITKPRSPALSANAHILRIMQSIFASGGQTVPNTGSCSSATS